MAKVNLSQAAKLTGKNRTTIWRHIHSGKLSIERDRDGLPFVDTSELIRVYGELEPVATGSTKKKPHQATYSYEDLIAIVELLRKEQAEMKAEIENLTNRLTYIPELNSKELSPVTQSKKPEDDPDWPKDIKTMADVLLRREITLKIDSTK
ncbi:hypothetical protein ACTTBA_20115 [Shewanella frigidimarina]|uniref:hypothetical protein n=1 Tax=Shewanella frigidimarina TaxID=56812 RepID=UPI003FA044A3